MSDQTRKLTQLQLFSLAFGSIIGVAWIPLVGFWLETAGSLGTLIAFVMGCITVMFVVAAYAEVSCMYPVNGGEVSYAQISLGSRYAFAVGWMLIFLFLGFTSFELLTIGWIAGILLPSVKGPVLYSILGSDMYAGQLAIGVATGIAICWLNIRGRDYAARVQELLSFILLLFALSMVVVALLYGDKSNLEPLIVENIDGQRFAGLFTIFSISMLFYGGFNFAAQIMGERGQAVTPGKIVTAIFLSLIAALLFYSAIIFSCSFLLPREQLLALELPAANMFVVAFRSESLRNLVLIVGIVGLVTSWNGAVFAGSRLLLMLGEVRLLPACFTRMHPRYGTPAVAMICLSVVTPLIALIGQGGIIALSKALSFSIAFAWMITVVSVMCLRRSRPQDHRPFRVKPAGLVFVLAVTGTSIAMLDIIKGFFVAGSLMPSAEGWIVLGWVSIGFVVWLLNAVHRKTMTEQERVAAIMNS